MSDTTRIMCPKLTCRKILLVPSTSRGKTVRCRACGTTIRVPMAAGKVGPGAAPTPAQPAPAKGEGEAPSAGAA